MPSAAMEMAPPGQEAIPEILQKKKKKNLESAIFLYSTASVCETAFL